MIRRNVRTIIKLALVALLLLLGTMLTLRLIGPPVEMPMMPGVGGGFMPVAPEQQLVKVEEPFHPPPPAPVSIPSY
jgi:hypothetical protein